MRNIRGVISLGMTSFIIMAMFLVPQSDGNFLSRFELKTRLKKCLHELGGYENTQRSSVFPSVDGTTPAANCRSVIKKYIGDVVKDLYLGLHVQGTYARSVPAIKNVSPIDPGVIKLAEETDEQSYPSRKDGSDYWRAMLVNYLDTVGKSRPPKFDPPRKSTRLDQISNPQGQTNLNFDDKVYKDTYLLEDQLQPLSWSDYEVETAGSIPSKREQLSVDTFRKTIGDMLRVEQSKNAVRNRELLMNIMLKDGR